jgi:hypothetical protein
MGLTVVDRLEINELIAMHGHLCDASAYNRFVEIFTADLVVDVSDLGLKQVPTPDPEHSLDAYIALSNNRGAGNTLSMHVTNIIIREDGNGARAWSKGLTVSKDGTIASFIYVDELVRTDQGWRIRRRKVSPRREPGQGIEPATK